MRQGLEAGFVHGKKGMDINYVPAYNPNAAELYADALNALNDMPFLLLEQIEACDDQPFSYLKALLVMGVNESVQDEAGTSTNPTSGETSSVGGDAEQFVIAPSVPYARDAGVTTQDITLVDEVLTVESDEVPTRTAFHDNAATTLAFAPDVFDSNPTTLIVTTTSLFQ
ncbi:hypothetical protein Tco_1190655 [Tanacetum coccineum]